MKIAFNDLVSYVKGELDLSAQIRIERLLLTDQESYEIVEKLIDLHQRGELEKIAEDVKNARRQVSMFSSFSLSLWRFAAAAAIILLVAGIGFYSIWQPKENYMSKAKPDSVQTQKVPDMEFYRLSPPQDSLK